MRRRSAGIGLCAMIVGLAFILIAGPSRAATCDTTVGSGNSSSAGNPVNIDAALNNAANSAAVGATICVASGYYAGFDIRAVKSGDITVQPVPGASVNFTSHATVSNGATHVVVQNFVFPHGIDIDAKSGNAPSYITFSHNDITTDETDGYAVILDSYDCAIQGGCTGSVPWIDYCKIIGNRFHDVGLNNNNSQDELEVKHTRHTEIAYNEFETALYDVNNRPDIHVDNIVIISGGLDVNVHHNYFHDNQSENFFIKDGHADDITFSQNLLLRDDHAPVVDGDIPVNVYDTTNLIMDNNTIWPNKSMAFQGAEPSTATLTDNVIEGYSNDGNWNITQSNNTIGGSPSFTNTAVDDYQLNPNPNGQGVNWKPSDFVYGPTSNPVSPADTTPPTVSLTAPAAGTVSGVVTLSATASDDVGMSNVQFKVDGATVNVDSTSPYSYSWDSTSVANGTHTVTAVATDSSSNQTTSSSVTVTVSNLTAPVNVGVPVISGITNNGAKLTATTGSWTNSPTSYGYQWLRCNVSGASCVNIPSATANTYVLTSGDVGSTIKISVIASNASGSSASAISSASGQIYKKGDTDHNGVINGIDVSDVTNNFGKAAAQSAKPNADTNSDGQINGIDLSNVTNNFGG